MEAIKKNVYAHLIDRQLQRILRFFYAILDGDNVHCGILKIAYDAIVVLVNTNGIKKENDVNHFKRAYYVFTIDLNACLARAAGSDWNDQV